MSLYTYEYFCGANVVVQVEGMELHEAAGISYSIQESKMPLYGYSSRHFDAMARGQVLVRGSLLVNYIHQDYLYEAIGAGRAEAKEIINLSAIATDPNAATRFNQSQAFSELSGIIVNEEVARDLASQILDNPRENEAKIAAFQGNFWDSGSPAFGVAPGFSSDPTGLNPHDMNSNINIKITFGQRSAFNNQNGLTGLLLSGVYFIGRGVPIQIDEEVIVEEYSFIARNVHTLNTETAIDGKWSDDGELAVEVFGRDGPADFGLSPRGFNAQTSEEAAQFDFIAADNQALTFDSLLGE